ncbi:MAG TPA: tetratricopeptide repeat protein [Terriglobales bacterium]|nr:tetratricopeptide repeat protein [Terriglobales bacterium]
MLQPRRFILPGLVCLLLSLTSTAQQKSRVELEPNETVFAVMTGINTCGYDRELDISDPVRKEVRSMVSRAIEKSSEAAQATQQMCAFYRDHSVDPARDLSQYVSLALNLGPAPEFKPTIKEADMPPDATYVLGFVPLVGKFYSAAGLAKIWTSVQPKYQSMIDEFHEPLANMILATDVYLKIPMSGYTGRQFVIYVEPMAGPGQVNARNYGENYYLVGDPTSSALKDQVRHTYLHFVLDPLAARRPTAMKKLDPVLKAVQSAPLDESYKRDASLLVTESLIRAIEARTMPGGKAAEPKREKEVADDMADGFVLTRYFYDSLIKFEQEPVALSTVFPDWLYYMDVSKQQKIAEQTTFVARGRGEVVSRKPAPPPSTLELANRKLAEGDPDGAEKLAMQAAKEQPSEAARAYMLLGRISALRRDKDSAIKYFEQALQVAKDPRLIAWSHIYLGRIYDVDQERDMAVKHYQAALRAGDDAPQTKAAAELGLKAPYQRQASDDKDQ